MKIVSIFHGPKVEGMDGRPGQIAANPTLTLDGQQHILDLVPVIEEQGPYAGFYCSRLARALDSASVIALEIDRDFEAIKCLGQHANKDGDTVIPYPGHEHESYVEWKEQVWDFLDFVSNIHDNSDTILVVSHRPIIGGMMGIAKGVEDAGGLKEIVNSFDSTDSGFVWDYTIHSRKLELDIAL